jgi:hypothetical protein
MTHPSKAAPAKAAAPAAAPAKAVPATPEDEREKKLAELAKKYGLPDEYVQDIRDGLKPWPPSLGDDHDGSTYLTYEGGVWANRKTGE